MEVICLETKAFYTPDWPEEQKQAENILVVEGEKDVMAADYALHIKGL